jgi:hypothetical protein
MQRKASVLRSMTNEILKSQEKLSKWYIKLLSASDVLRLKSSLLLLNLEAPCVAVVEEMSRRLMQSDSITIMTSSGLWTHVLLNTWKTLSKIVCKFFENMWIKG